MGHKMTGPSLDGPRSAYELLEVYGLMSIPHFQRGLVWDTSAVALLLESLYYQTPCGSIILWAPADVSAQGNRLGKSARYLIVDGQQRIRSLHDVFRDADDDSVTSPGTGGDADDETDSGLSEEGGDDEKGVWCLNLGRLPEFEDRFPAANGSGFSDAPRIPETNTPNSATEESVVHRFVTGRRWCP